MTRTAFSTNDPPARGTTECPRILAVDDSAANLSALEAALSGLGRQVTLVRSGREALRLLLRDEFALILLDVKMPDLDGFETARIIRERPRTRHLPIIFLTAYERDDRQILQAYSLGAVDFLFKPLVAEVLRAKVSVLLALEERALEIARQGERLRHMERRQQEIRLAEERKNWENERLRDESRRKDEFLAMLAHELRNPLSPVVAGVEILKSTSPADGPQRRVCDVMERQVQHLVRLVDDLLDISRISRGKIEIRNELFDLVEAVQHALESARPSVEQRNQELCRHLENEPLIMCGDRSRIVQLVSNLLTNASRYSPHNGKIEVTLTRTGHEARLTVADEGKGIRPEMLDRIFDMFFQEREGGKGLGLGLTLVRRIVELHKGSVTVHSDGIDQGATFTVVLPLESNASALALSDSSPASERGVRERALLVAVIEDDDDVRDSARILFESWGHQVIDAPNGAAGFNVVRRHNPDIVFIDIAMHGMDGYEVARRIREDFNGAGPYLVAITGHGRPRDKERARQAGFNIHLVKPATVEALRDALRKGAQWPAQQN